MIRNSPEIFRLLKFAYCNGDFMIGRRTCTIIALISLILLSGCQSLGLAGPQATPTPPAPTLQPETELTICTAVEPESLYPYALSSQMAEDISQMIYDGPIDSINGESVPRYSRGIARFQPGDGLFQDCGSQRPVIAWSISSVRLSP